MPPIRRAAVTGLFAVWLAPLSAGTQGPGGTACGRGEAPPRAEQALARDREAEAGRRSPIRGWTDGNPSER
jgi:hypothetical protein